MLSSLPNLIAAGWKPNGGQSWARAGSNATASKNACGPEGPPRRACRPPHRLTGGHAARQTFREAGDCRSPPAPCQTRWLALQRAGLLDQRLRIADLELARRFDVERLDDAVLDEHRIALRADPHAARGQIERQPGRLGEIGAAV